MNEIKIYLKPSGSTAELYKDFNLYQGSYRNVQITIYAPSAMMYSNADNTYFNTVQTGAIMTAPNGAKVVTKSYNAAFVKTEVYNGVEYAVYTQTMPKEYALYAGTQLIVCNVVSIDNTDQAHPQIISVTTSQRAPLTVLESAYLGDDEPLTPSESEVIEGLINDLQQRLNEGEFAARAIYAWNSEYIYGANELVFYPQKGAYGVFLKSLTDNNKAEPYVDGVLDTGNWLLVSDFNILTELYSLKGDIANSAAIAAQNAQAAGQSASAAASSSQQVAQSATAAENAAQRVETQAQYLEGIKDGTIAVPKATSDGAGNDIANQFAIVDSDIRGLREDINNEAHFRGMFDSVEDLQAQYPTATPNDYAYIVGGNQYIYQNGVWTDSEEPSPNTAVPASNAIPLMDGMSTAGVSSEYSRGDHRHPSDTTKANAVDLANEVTARENADNALTETANKNLYNLGAFDTVVSNGDGTVTITRKTGYEVLSSDRVVTEGGKTAGGLYGYLVSNNKIASSFIANFPVTTSQAGWESTTPNMYILPSGIIMLCLDTGFSDISKAKQYVAEHPIFIQYDLSTSYTETVKENQPIHTLNQDGEQWMREEWEKGLNLLNLTENTYTKNGITVQHIRPSQIKANGTATSNVDMYIDSPSSGNSYTVLDPTKNYYCTANAGEFKVYFAVDLTNNTTQYTPSGQYLAPDYLTAKQLRPFIRIPSGAVCNNKIINIMLNEGTHPYPYQPYFGGIVRVNQLETKVSKSGDTMSGNLAIEKSIPNVNASYTAKRTDTGSEIWFGIGSGGTNRGIWDVTLEKWVLHTDGNNVYVNGYKFNSEWSTGTISSTGSVRLTSSGTTDINYNRIFSSIAAADCPRILTVFGLETQEMGGLIISTDTSPQGKTYDHATTAGEIARAEGERGWWAQQFLCCTAFIPAGKTPYIYGRYINNCVCTITSIFSK